MKTRNSEMTKKSTNQENVDLVTLFLPLIVPVALYWKKEMSRDDEVRLLHESYQFLVRKYHLQSPDEDKEFRNDKKSTN